MLLATTLMLLVFRSPSAIVSVMWLISARMFIYEKPPFPLRKFHSIANLCATINAATTFIMFIIYGAKFRSEFTRIYCCLVNIKRLKRTPAMRQEQQQMRDLIGINEYQSRMNNNDIPLTIETNGNPYKQLTRLNSGSTTRTSIGSLSLLQRFRNHRRTTQRFSFDEEHNAMMNHKLNTHINGQLQHEITIPEDDCNGELNNTKSGLIRESCFNWFKSFIGCHS